VECRPTGKSGSQAAPVPGRRALRAVAKALSGAEPLDYDFEDTLALACNSWQGRDCPALTHHLRLRKAMHFAWLRGATLFLTSEHPMASELYGGFHFVPPTTLRAPSSSRLAVQDVNGDGLADLATLTDVGLSVVLAAP
jgi:hypothetical protein